jgi:hypothetical protein
MTAYDRPIYPRLFREALDRGAKHKDRKDVVIGMAGECHETLQNKSRLPKKALSRQWEISKRVYSVPLSFLTEFILFPFLKVPVAH